MNDVNYDQLKNLQITIPTLFIRGSNSNYILNEDIEKIKIPFTNAKVITIDNAGHWIHAEQPINLLKIITNFI